MVKNKNLLRVPAMITQPLEPMSFEVKEYNKFVSLVQLKVFYVGTTPDNREFTEDFSQKVLASLPQTPVVAYYDKEDEDFVGHNYEQYVYGYVPEIGTIEFEEIDGQTWAVTDIILFTGRNDNIGEVANKIFNKQHSLELSDDTSYVVEKDSSGNNKLVFLDTSGVIGLSVLGDNQAPGFTGSEFFTRDENEKTLAALISQYATIKEQELLPLNFTESFKSGGAVMDLKQTIAHLNEFMKATFDEIYMDVQNALLSQNDWFYIMDISEDKVVYIDYNDGTFYRAGYERTEEGVVFEEAVKVRARFLTDDEIDELFAKADTDFEGEGGEGGEGEEGGGEEGNNDPEPEEPEGEPEPQGEGDGDGDGDDDGDDEGGEAIDDPQNIDIDDVTDEEDKKKKREAEIIYIEKIVPQFNEEELEQLEKDRIELEAYRTKDKEAVIESFAEFLTEEQANEFKENLADYTAETLEQALSVIAMKKVREAKDVDEFSSAFGIQSANKNGKNKSGQSLLARLVAENK